MLLALGKDHKCMDRAVIQRGQWALLMVRSQLVVVGKVCVEGNISIASKVVGIVSKVGIVGKVVSVSVKWVVER